MLDGTILETLRCLECGKPQLTAVADTIITCQACNATIENDVAPIFIRSGRLQELDKLINLNIKDRPEGHTSEGARVHGKEVYETSGYSQRLVDELQPKPGDLILDLGCGRGQISEALVTRGHQVLSVDIVRENLVDVRNDNKIFASIDQLPIVDASYDCVVCTDVFEHLYPAMQREVISEIYRVLKPNGRLLISFPGNNLPNLTGVHLLNIAIFFLRVFDSRVQYLTWKEPPAHINMSYPWVIRRAFKQAGFDGEIRPYSNKYFSLPARYRRLAMLLNMKPISMFFVHLMHGVLTKPAARPAKK